MSTETATDHGLEEGHEEHHEHHWETSSAPLIAVIGIFFLLPIGFSAYFVYQNTLLAVFGAGVGVPMILWGVAKWVSEGLTEIEARGHEHGWAKLALPIFIVSEALIFLSFFASYWMMRLGAEYWPPEGTPEISTTIPLIMTVILVASSVTIHIGEEKLEHGDNAGFIKWLRLTILLGVLFVCFTAYEYNHLIHEDFIPSTNAYSTIFFAITGFHASHVILGLGIFIFMLLPAQRGRISPTFVLCGSVYWHFVDIVWFFVASQIYFW